MGQDNAIHNKLLETIPEILTNYISISIRILIFMVSEGTIKRSKQYSNKGPSRFLLQLHVMKIIQMNIITVFTFLSFFP